MSKTRPFEYLRLTSLGVIGALVKASSLLLSRHPARDVYQERASSPFGKLPTPAPTTPLLAPQVDDTEVTNFLLSTEIIPLCLRTMEMGSELSKTVATFIVQKILLDEVTSQRKPSSS